MKKTIVFSVLIACTFLLFSCEPKARFHEISPAGNSFVDTISINNKEWTAPTYYVNPYQKISLTCYDQPCSFKLNGKIVEIKLKQTGDRSFAATFYTVPFRTKDENSFQVSDHDFMYLMLTKGAYKDNVDATFGINNMNEAEITRAKEYETSLLAEWAFYIIAFLFSLGIVSFLIWKFRFKNMKKEQPQNPVPDDKFKHEPISAEDILNADDY